MHREANKTNLQGRMGPNAFFASIQYCIYEHAYELLIFFSYGTWNIT